MDEQIDGYVFEYYGAENEGYTIEGMTKSGFYPRGTKVCFANKNGWDHERERALELLGTEKTYTVKWCRIGGWSSSYEFDEVEGSFNHVMFERAD